MDITEIPLDKNRIIKNLEAGNPIICVVGPGDFTSTGHFIVMTGCSDGKIKINDPNSMIRSQKLWDFEEIKDQIRNLWVCRRK
ncbi:MAG: C39 family peptidase [Acutalibacteraceae bacterium]